MEQQLLDLIATLGASGTTIAIWFLILNFLGKLLTPAVFMVLITCGYKIVNSMIVADQQDKQRKADDKK
tara:strand:+ start:317 stop:523 length:207 start_codon:yes stop_codon:yes gene_type:complete